MKFVRPIAPAILVLMFLALFGSSRGLAVRAGESDIAFVGANIYISPEAAPIANGIVIVRAGKIAAVGKTGEIPVPPGAKKIDCSGKFLPRDFRTATCITTSRKNGPARRIFPRQH